MFQIKSLFYSYDITIVQNLIIRSKNRGEEIFDCFFLFDFWSSIGTMCLQLYILLTMAISALEIDHPNINASKKVDKQLQKLYTSRKDAIILQKI